MNMSINNDRLLRTEDAAEYLSLSTDSVRRLIRSGKLPAYKFAERRWRVRKSDCDALLEPSKAARYGR
jgi:excisionase family DNA binding protein